MHNFDQYFFFNHSNIYIHIKNLYFTTIKSMYKINYQIEQNIFKNIILIKNVKNQFDKFMVIYVNCSAW